MGMIINRRRAYGGKSLPYDAEVEYLESTGTQWIDTGVYPDNTYTFDCKVAVLQDNYNCVYWGVRNTGTYQSYNSQCYLNSNTSEIGLVASRSIHLYSTTADANVSAYNQNWNSRIIPTIGTMYSLTGMTVVSTMITMAYPVTLFAFNIKGNVGTPYNIRIGSWTAYSNGIKIADLMPVRVGSVGYLYDKVSGQLFGNNGTGSFILGQDV